MCAYLQKFIHIHININTHIGTHTLTPFASLCHTTTQLRIYQRGNFALNRPRERCCCRKWTTDDRRPNGWLRVASPDGGIQT